MTLENLENSKLETLKEEILAIKENYRESDPQAPVTFTAIAVINQVLSLIEAKLVDRPEPSFKGVF